MTSDDQDKNEQRAARRASHGGILAALVACATAALSPAAAADDAAVASLFAGGRPILELRPRYNRIDESDKPLLTDFYAFNGWTLHFFNTPFAGLRDRCLTLRPGHAPAGLVFYAEAHRFRSDFRDLDYGRETDVGLSWSFMGSAMLRVQHARYERGSGQVAPGIHETWVTFTYTY